MPAKVTPVCGKKKVRFKTMNANGRGTIFHCKEGEIFTASLRVRFRYCDPFHSDYCGKCPHLESFLYTPLSTLKHIACIVDKQTNNFTATTLRKTSTGTSKTSTSKSRTSKSPKTLLLQCLVWLLSNFGHRLHFNSLNFGFIRQKERTEIPF